MKAINTLRFLVAILSMVSLACSFSRLPGSQTIKTGPTETLTIIEPYPDTNQLQDVNLSMAIGEFTLSGGAAVLLRGQVRYNVEQWKPEIVNENNSLTVAQGDRIYTFDAFSEDDVVNVWDIRLGSIPMNLVIEAGAYDASLDLSGLAGLGWSENNPSGVPRTSSQIAQRLSPVIRGKLGYQSKTVDKAYKVKTLIVSAGKTIDAPADELYRIIADYQSGHPNSLPKSYFPFLEVEEGRYGEGTI